MVAVVGSMLGQQTDAARVSSNSWVPSGNDVGSPTGCHASAIELSHQHHTNTNTTCHLYAHMSVSHTSHPFRWANGLALIQAEFACQLMQVLAEAPHTTPGR